MSRHAPALIPVAMLGLTLCTAAPVRAQQLEVTPTVMASVDRPIVTAAMPPTSRLLAEQGTLLAEQVSAPAVFAPLYAGPRRPSWFTALHVLTAGLQVADAHSTLSGLKMGAVEANPLMSPVAKNGPALVAVKATVAAGVIYATERMSRGNRVAAVLTAIAINGTYAMVVAHNYRLARALR